MNKKITFKTKDNIYSINIETNSTVKNLNKIITTNNKVVFLIDRKVFYIFKKLKNYKNQKYLVINCSEKLKSFNNYEKISEKILNFNIDRSTKVVAIGGGTLGDLSGFIASTILRGIDLILFPTTLLSQVDSSIGGKNGINTNSGKNLVGTFYQPKHVYIDPKILKTLSKREILSGYAEIIKHAIINDIKFFNWLHKNSKKILTLDNKILSEAIYKSVIIKRKYVLKDEKENLKNNNSRAILNFGHTFGHALETYYKYNKKLTHGEAISIGMIIAAILSYKLGYLPLKHLNNIKHHFASNNLPLSDDKMFKEKIFKIIEKDKKNDNKKINFVLLKKIGSAFLSNNLNLDKIKTTLK
ncbi:3-dehydroquinate synthase [Alphaproteobacteria bacterium]|jgi:shikimate kinase / 3-dehydroquinate synthase|nr:3-dehydroquinate synthase [Alphaproteobacteria bacterium]MDC3270150.1 3-dehydroquinate synthase [Alphaproteobacteria bacterium]